MPISEMGHKVDKRSLSKLLSDAIPMLCKNSLPMSSAFRVEAMIGVTLFDDTETLSSSDNDVVLICFKQTITSSGSCVVQPYGDNDSDDIKPSVENSERQLLVRKSFTTAASATSSAAIGSALAVKEEPYSQDLYGNETIDIADDEAAEGYNDQYTDDQAVYDAQNEEEYEPGASQDYNEYYPTGGSDSAATVFHRPVKGKTANANYDMCIKSEELTHNVEDNSSAWYDQVDDGSQQGRQQNKGSFLQRKGRSHFGVSLSGVGKMRKPKKSSFGNTAATFSGANVRANKQPTGQMPIHTADDQRDMLIDTCRKIANQSIIAKQFICHICNAQLSHKGALVAHIKAKHLATGLYNCELCGANFKWSNQLLRHRKIHSEIQ